MALQERLFCIYATAFSTLKKLPVSPVKLHILNIFLVKNVIATDANGHSVPRTDNDSVRNLSQHYPNLILRITHRYRILRSASLSADTKCRILACVHIFVIVQARTSLCTTSNVPDTGNRTFKGNPVSTN